MQKQLGRKQLQPPKHNDLQKIRSCCKARLSLWTKNMYFRARKKSHHSHRRDRILRFFLRTEIGQIYPHLGSISLRNLHSKPGERGKKSTGENSKHPVETGPRNCRFLSLVLVEFRICPEFGLRHFRSSGASQSKGHNKGTVNPAPSPQKTFLIMWYFWGGGGGVRIVGTQEKGKILLPALLQKLVGEFYF